MSAMRHMKNVKTPLDECVKHQYLCIFKFSLLISPSDLPIKASCGNTNYPVCRPSSGARGGFLLNN